MKHRAVKRVTKALTVEGRPLSELGLNRLRMRHPDGTLEPILGLVIYRNETIEDALIRTLPRGCSYVVPEKSSK